MGLFSDNHSIGMIQTEGKEVGHDECRTTHKHKRRPFPGIITGQLGSPVTGQFQSGSDCGGCLAWTSGETPCLSQGLPGQCARH